MSKIHRPLVGALLALCTSASFASRSIAPLSFDDETTLTHQDSSHIAMVMWWSKADLKTILPDDTDPAEARRFAAALKGYAIFGLVDVRLDAANFSISDADRAKLRSSARLKLGNRPARTAAREEDLPEPVRRAVRLVQPTAASVLGKFGDAIEFVVFRDADEHGESLADPALKIDVTMTFDKESFSWHMPLASLLPLRVDPATGDTFPGDYDFSPFTGHKLETAR